MSSGFRDAPYFGILFFPFVMVSVSSASDIPCTAAVVKSWVPIFVPIAEPAPSAPWHATHFDLYRVSDAFCACADSESTSTTAIAVTVANPCILIVFIIMLLLMGYLCVFIQIHYYLR